MSVIYIKNSVPMDTPLLVKKFTKLSSEYIYFDNYFGRETEITGQYNSLNGSQYGFLKAITGGGKFNNEINFISGDIGCVTERIGDDAFSHCNSIISVSFPTVTSIGNNAFSNCANLVTLDFKKLKTIGDYAFEKDNALSIIDFPELESLGEGAFSECWGIKSVNLPKIKELKTKSFYFCGLLESIKLDSIESFGTRVFGSCSKTLSIDLSENNNFDLSSISLSGQTNNLDFPFGTTIICKDGVYFVGYGDYNPDEESPDEPMSEIDINPLEFTFKSEGEQSLINIYAYSFDYKFTIEEGYPDWIEFSKTYQEGTGVIEIIAKENLSYEDRTTTIRIKITNSDIVEYKDIQIIQLGKIDIEDGEEEIISYNTEELLAAAPVALKASKSKSSKKTKKTKSRKTKNKSTSTEK